jgi:hypothetical protein
MLCVGRECAVHGPGSSHECFLRIIKPNAKKKPARRVATITPDNLALKFYILGFL